jgi:2',3'-cyclic-nucleotide 2'-phosphodiesterase (5'-nucleotidase family)
MNITRRQALATGALGALATSGASQPSQGTQPDGVRKISGTKSAQMTIIQINDCHGYLELHNEWFPGPDGRPIFKSVGGYARIATLVRQIKKQMKDRVLFTDNGDTFHGTRPVVESRGRQSSPSSGRWVFTP